jgi:two-component system nitrate/nitrite response regulator NarL
MGDVTRVAIAAVDPIYRQGLDRVMASGGFQTVALSSAVHELLSSELHAHSPDLFLLDFGDDMAGLAHAIGSIRREFPASKIVIVADGGSEPHFIRALQEGAAGLLVKPIGCDALVKTMELIVLGERIFPAKLIRRIAVEDLAQAPVCADRNAIDQLSARELDVLQQLSSGSPNKLIARRFGITEATVKVHVKAILRKLGVRNRTQAALYARNQDWPMATPSDVSTRRPLTM